MNATNKNTFKAEYFNLHIFHKDTMHQDTLGLMFSPTKNYVNPPVNKNELKELADFINNYLKDFP